jgi:hypothetical protein
MTTDFLPLRLLLVTLAGWVSRHQQHVIEYLVEENRILCSFRSAVGRRPGRSQSRAPVHAEAMHFYCEHGWLREATPTKPALP